MRSLLKEFGITPAVGFDRLIHRAWEVHELRPGLERGMVSRSSLLYAAATLEPLVLTLLETNGLRFRAWEQSLGFDERPQFEYVEQPPPDLDFEVNVETTQSALHAYRERWPRRPIDSLGLTSAIMFHLGGQAARHLTEAGFDEERGASRFEDFVNASPDGDLIDRSIFESSLTDLSHSVIKTAVSFAQERGVRFQAITTSELFIGAMRTIGAQPPSAPAFLRKWMADAVPDLDLDRYIGDWMAFYAEGEAEFDDLRLLTQPTAAVIERALVIAEEAAEVKVVSARHLVGALIASHRWAASAGVTDFLRDLEINPHLLAKAYFDYLSTAPVANRRDDMLVWRGFLGLRDDSFLPRFNAEDVSGDDLLNVKDDVNAFATLIASKRIHPPLSIGLFGDWGSGKSFFMAKMRQKIAEYAARGNARSDSPFHGRVVQIEFNAWHYVEANLWASLVEHLFRNLKLTFEKPDAEAIEKRREELLQKLDSLLAKRAEAEKKVREAELKRDQATQDLDAQKKAAESSAALAQGLRAQDVWELVDIGQDTRDELQKQLNQLGAGRVMKSNEDVRKTVDELRSVASRTKLLTNWIIQQPRALVLLLILLVLAPFAAAALSTAIKFGPDWLKSISQGAVQVTTMIGTAVAWLAKRLSSGRQILEKLDAARGRIDEEIQTAESKRQAIIDAADKNLVAAHAEVEATKKDVESNEKEVADAKTALLQLTTDYRLTRFIDERAASDDYRKLLGVLATVRNDFAMLSELMNAPKEESQVSADSRIDRIVLYIDDLDRCPPDKVVDVLQAVHLLLAFKLFVVVVGVDARWISESLEQHHRALRAKGKDGKHVEALESSVIGYEVRPHDYLEKIFQVPFWLQRLEWEKTSSYMGNLLAEDVLRDDSLPRRKAAARNGSADAGGQQAIETRKLHYTLGDDDAPESDPKQLTIDEKELTYMTGEHLAELVGRSPRTAKRFVNTYRFFRASIPPKHLESYLLDGDPPDYECALVLMAIVIGAPDVSPEVFSSMKKAVDSESLKNFAKTLPTTGRYLDQWDTVRSAFKHFNGKAKLQHLKPHIARVTRFSFRAPYETQTAAATPPQPMVQVMKPQEAPIAVPPQ